MSGKPVARVGDSGSHGGAIIDGSLNIRANGHPIALVGSTYNCPVHGPNPIVTGAQSVFGNEFFVAHVGSKTACGAEIISGSPDVFIGVHENHEIAYEDNVSEEYDEQIVAIDSISGEPISYYPFFIETEEGVIYKGRTDDNGKTPRVKTSFPQILTVYWGEDAVFKWDE